MPHDGPTAHPPPPPPDIEDAREMFLPYHPFRFQPFWLGLAFGIACAIFMVFAMVISNPGGMKFFEDIFPGYTYSRTIGSFLVGLFWSFGAGFVMGTVTGIIYNWKLRKYAYRTQFH